MFDISWTEILIVAVIAIIVVGPKELPGMLRAFGKTFGQVRRTAREFQSTFNDALREAERQANLDEVKKDIASVGKLDPRKALSKELDETKKALSGKVDDAAPPKPDVVPLNGGAKTAGAKTAGAHAGGAKAAGSENGEPASSDASPGGEAPAPDSESALRAAAGGERG